MKSNSDFLFPNNKLKKNIINNSLITENDPVVSYHYRDINKFLRFNEGENRYKEIINNVINDYENKKILTKFKDFYNKNKKNKYIDFVCDNDKNIKMINSDITLISVGGYGQIYKINDDTCLKINLEDVDYDHEFEIPKQLSRMPNDTIKKLILTPYSIIKNCKFSGLLNIININVFFVYIIYILLFKKKLNTADIEKKLTKHSINHEFNELFVSNEKKKINTAIDLYNFFCLYYLKHEEHINILKYLPRLINMFKNKQGNLKDIGYIILMPLLKSNSVSLLLDEESKQIDNKKGTKAYKVIKHFYRILFLQMSLLVLNINDVTEFTHNDFKADNVLVDAMDDPYELSYKNSIFKFSERFVFKLADFDFSLLKEYTQNNKLKNKTLFKETNWLTDIHFFIHSLFYYISKDEYLSDKFFFDTLFNKFISPYCNITVTKLLSTTTCVQKKDSKEFCISGRLVKQKYVDISELENFIHSELFKEWM